VGFEIRRAVRPSEMSRVATTFAKPIRPLQDILRDLRMALSISRSPSHRGGLWPRCFDCLGTGPEESQPRLCNWECLLTDLQPGRCEPKDNASSKIAVNVGYLGPIVVNTVHVSNKPVYALTFAYEEHQDLAFCSMFNNSLVTPRHLHVAPLAFTDIVEEAVLLPLVPVSVRLATLAAE